jgi:hypothetical protein
MTPAPMSARSPVNRVTRYRRRPCPRRALSSGPRRSPTVNSGQLPESLSCASARWRAAQQCFPSSRCCRARIDLAVPGRPIRSLVAGGPERRRRPRPDRTGTPIRAGSMAHGSTGARAVTNGHQRRREPAGRRARRLRQLARSQQPDQIVVPKITRPESARPRTATLTRTKGPERLRRSSDRAWGDPRG